MALPPLAALPEMSLPPPPPPPAPPPPGSAALAGPAVLPSVHEVLALSGPGVVVPPRAAGTARRLPAIHEIGLGLRVRDGRVTKRLSPAGAPAPPALASGPPAPAPAVPRSPPPAPGAASPSSYGSSAPPAPVAPPDGAPPPPGSPAGAAAAAARGKDASRLKKELERKRCHQEQTRKSRRKMNDRIERIRKELPPPPPGIEVRHKAQILEYCITILKSFKKESPILKERIEILHDENRMLKRQLEALKWNPAR